MNIKDVQAYLLNVASSDELRQTNTLICDKLKSNRTIESLRVASQLRVGQLVAVKNIGDPKLDGKLVIVESVGRTWVEVRLENGRGRNQPGYAFTPYKIRARCLEIAA